MVGGRTEAQSGPPPIVGEREATLDDGVRRDGLLEPLLADRSEPELRPTEHRECAVRVKLSPAQVDEPLAGLALHPWAAKVQATVASGDDLDLEIPTCLKGVAGNEVDDLAFALHADVDRLVHGLGDAGQADTAHPGEITASDADRDLTHNYRRRW